ncbi:MAG: YedE-related selenium metabolism membrane protein [Synergistaceae bacterium]|jgi:YedE family putative selenium metabolism protein|nr:YedE-related selenium metabolism membrane protein [Synergistaceae bacterium]
MDKILTSRRGPWVAGGLLGGIAVLLAYWGNPANMGFCAACFTRDIAGALGLHRAGAVQYLRPEIPAFILGSFASALFFREYSPRGGSSPAARFFLGVCAMFGALVFLGCPWRAYLRVAGGDWNALYGVAGLAAGVLIGIAFLWNGFSLGAAGRNPKASGLLMPLAALALLGLVFFPPLLGPSGPGPVFFSKEGPGSQHAPLLVSLAAGLLMGWLAQRSRFCTVGALRDLLMMREGHLFKGIVAFTAAAFTVNYALGQFHPGFEKQPIAHTQELWNFLGMVLSGLAFTLAGGCPGRQLSMAGEGDADAAVFVLGMLTGAALAHNFSAASSGAGVGPFGVPATVVGLVMCGLIGFGCREKAL